jgi:hypothetical protein
LDEIEIKKGGYLPYTALVPRCNHRTLWIDIQIEDVLGHKLPPIVCPQMCRLQFKDPRSIDNFIQRYKCYIAEDKLLEKAKAVEAKAEYPLSDECIKEYEELDVLRRAVVAKAERKCRKLKAGQDEFSLTLKALMNQIKAWTLLKKRSQS